jgi:hypothetical protein
MKIKQLFATVIVAASLSGLPQFVHAGSSPSSHSSPSSPSSHSSPSSPSSPSTKVPFDGGLSLLVATGIGIGIKKGYDKRKKQAATSVEN